MAGFGYVIVPVLSLLDTIRLVNGTKTELKNNPLPKKKKKKNPPKNRAEKYPPPKIRAEKYPPPKK